MERARAASNPRRQRRSPVPPRLMAIPLVALALVVALLGHGALMAAMPPGHAAFAGAAESAPHEGPHDLPHPPACGPTRMVAAPRADDGVGGWLPVRLPAPAPAGASESAAVAKPRPFDRAVPRACLQVWRV